MPQTQISILGCGWLGLPLAKNLIEKGFSINGSTTSESKLDILENAGIKPFLISLEAQEIRGNIEGFLEHSEILIIDIPPKLKGDSNESFVAKIQNLVLEIEKYSVQKVIFISSTSVYPDTENIPILTEKDIPNPDTESGRQLCQAEKLLSNNPNFSTTILRFGGLIGEDRHPIKFLSGRKNIENPDGPINLIHQKDCIGIISKIIEKGIWNQIFNAVAPFHPSRKEYYNKKALCLQLPLVEFNEDSISIGKVVDSKNIIQIMPDFNESYKNL